jgi:hypothetical protein
MNTEINNNDRKKHSKTLAIAGMGFLLIAAAFTFSFANSGQQLVSAQENQTAAGGANQTAAGGANQTAAGGANQTAAGGANQTAAGGANQTAAGGANGTPVLVAVPYDTFIGNGPITANIPGQDGQPYIIGGNWNIDVLQRNVTEFSADFLMVHPDGSGYHTHNITSFVTGTPNVALVQGQNTSISGTADIYTNGTIAWPGANTTLSFAPNGTVMTIMPAPDQTDNHFQGQPIYGIVSGLAGENGTMITQTTPPAAQQEQQEEEEGGEPQAGGEGGGGPLSGITDPLQDLFGGGG